jgi:hypothetical protein
MLPVVNRDQFKPPQDVLNQCHRVDVDGDKHNPKNMRTWAREHCESFIWWESTDMSDISSWPGPDNYCSYYFYKDADATAFRLRWA